MAEADIRETLALVGDLRDLAKETKLGETEKEVAAKRRLLRIASEISDCLTRLEERLRYAPADSHSREREARRNRLIVLGRVTAEVGYQLNNFLALASTRLELMEIALQSGDKEKALANTRLARDYLRQVEALSVRLTDFSEEPAQALRGDLNGIVRNTVSFARLLASYENIDFELDLAGGLPPVFVDPSQWQQLLISLIANAADAVGRRKGEGGRIRVATSHDPEKGCVLLVVRDEGCGIAPEHLPRVFDPGFTTRAGAREGLGLTTCKRIVEEARGAIELASTPGRGTTVSIRLPVGSAPSEQG
jgi:signal transduction histidine kinase